MKNAAPMSLATPSAAERFGAFCCTISRIGRGLTDVKNAAPSTYGSESIGADGGYLVPPDFRAELIQAILSEDSLLAYTLRMTTDSNAVAFPVDMAPPWTGSGIVVKLDSEGTPRPPSAHQAKPAVQGLATRLEKLTAFVPMSSELYEDAPGLSAYLSSAVMARITFKLNDLILNGTGVGQPLGILNSPALITQAKEGGQSAATVNIQNVTKMWAKLYGPSKRRAVWIANTDVESHLSSMTLGGTMATFPTYIPAGLNGNPMPLLNGRPVIYSEAAAALGQVGDLVLADLGAYVTALKVRKSINPDAAPGDADLIQQDLSMHVFFDQDMAALRFTLRVAGQGIWSAPITRKVGGQVSTFVALEAR